MAANDTPSNGSTAGALAYAAELARLTARLARSLPARNLGPVGRAMDRARSIAAGGDFIRAVHTLGKVHIDELAVGNTDRRRRAMDLEAALVTTRQAVLAAPDGPQRADAEKLLRAARLELSQHHWSAARALLDEAEDRLEAEEYVRPQEL